MYLLVVLAGLRWQIHWLQWSTVVNLWMNSCWWHRRQEEPQKRSCNKWQALVCTFPGLQCPKPVKSNKDRSPKSEHFLNKVSPKWKKRKQNCQFFAKIRQNSKDKNCCKKCQFSALNYQIFCFSHKASASLRNLQRLRSPLHLESLVIKSIFGLFYSLFSTSPDFQYLEFMNQLKYLHWPQLS